MVGSELLRRLLHDRAPASLGRGISGGRLRRSSGELKAPRGVQPVPGGGEAEAALPGLAGGEEAAGRGHAQNLLKAG